MNRAVVIIGVVAAFVLVGVVNLSQTNRASAAAVKDAEARLDSVPTTIGAWTSTPAPVTGAMIQRAEAQAYLSRTYTRGRTGPAVNVLILYGDPGPLGAHTPQVCYAEAGYKQLGTASRRTIAADDAADELWTARFETAGYPPSFIQLTWGWGADGVWAAADTPRVDFAAHSRIYKLYMSRGVAPTARPDDPDPTAEFVGPFLRAVRACLTGPTPPADSIPSAARGAVCDGPCAPVPPGDATP